MMIPIKKRGDKITQCIYIKRNKKIYNIGN